MWDASWATLTDVNRCSQRGSWRGGGGTLFQVYQPTDPGVHPSLSPALQWSGLATRTPHTTPRRQLWWSIQGWEQVGISSTWARVMDGLYLFFLAGRYRVQKELFVRPLEIKLRRWSWLWNFKSGPAFGPAYRTFWSHLVYQTRLPILVVRLSFDFLLCLCRSVHAALNTCGGLRHVYSSLTVSICIMFVRMVNIIIVINHFKLRWLLFVVHITVYNSFTLTHFKSALRLKLNDLNVLL